MNDNQHLTTSAVAMALIWIFRSGIIRVAIIVLSVYAAFAFAAWDLNPANWSDTARGFCAFCATGLAIVAAIAP